LDFSDFSPYFLPEFITWKQYDSADMDGEKEGKFNSNLFKLRSHCCLNMFTGADGLKNVINEYVFAAISYSQKSKKTYTHLLPFR